MKWIFYIAALVAALLVPVERSDVGQLQPIEVVSLSAEGAQIIVRTDTGDEGKGVTVDEAIRNLKDTTAGIVYLDTAEYLLVYESAFNAVSEMRRHLKEKVMVCAAEGKMDLELAAGYLDVHSPQTILEQWSGDPEEVLACSEDRFVLKNKREKDEKSA